MTPTIEQLSMWFDESNLMFFWLLTVVFHSGFLMIPYALYTCYVYV